MHLLFKLREGRGGGGEPLPEEPGAPLGEGGQKFGFLQAIGFSEEAADAVSAGSFSHLAFGHGKSHPQGRPFCLQPKAQSIYTQWPPLCLQTQAAQERKGAAAA